MDGVVRFVSNRWVVLAARLALGGIFLASAIGKLQHPALFMDQVVDYGLLPEGLSRLYATVLPWAEVAVGFSLILGLLSAAGAMVSAAMTASFAIAGIYSLLRPEEVPSLCGCFGELVSLSHAQSLALDAAMLLMAALIVAARGKADVPGLAGAVTKLIRDKPKWLAYALQLASVALLTVAVGLPITLAGEKPAGEPPLTEKPRLMYFWNGCPECYGAEVDQVKSLQPEYADRVDFVAVDYVIDPSSLGKYGVTDDDFTVLLLTWQSETAEYSEYTRFAGNLKAGTFDLAAIRDGLETLLDTGGQHK